MIIEYPLYGIVYTLEKGQDYNSVEALTKVLKEHKLNYSPADDDLNFTYLKLYFTPQGAIYKKERLQSVTFDIW